MKSCLSNKEKNIIKDYIKGNSIEFLYRSYRTNKSQIRRLLYDNKVELRNEDDYPMQPEEF